MSLLTIGWEYLTGYAVATDPSSRDRAEWPPHPGRVFMALSAAWFETEPLVTGDDASTYWGAEGDALRWLESLGDPELCLPLVEPEFVRSNVTVYVPVNDKAGPSSATLQSAPALTRSKQARTFPRVWVGHESCSMHWPQAGGVEEHLDSLDRLCRKVTRIGHSSSLVRMWACNEPSASGCSIDTWVANEELADAQVRTVSEGMLRMLSDRFGASARKRHSELIEQIDALKAQKKAAKGQGSKERKAEIDEQIKLFDRKAEELNPRPPVRPSLGLWSGYRRGARAAPTEAHLTLFDTDMLVLTNVNGPRLPLVSTLAVTRALRNTIMSASGVQPVPAWMSGHEANGQPLRSDDDGHLAIISLPFVGHMHADGHLVGVGLVFPRSVDRRERGKVLGKLLLDGTSGQPRELKLTLGRLGEWTIVKRDWTETRQALVPENWTGDGHGGADRWASVTPVVLDRFPKSDHLKDRPAWTQEVVEIISAACVRIGLPVPMDIDIDTTSWHLRSPRATCKRRPLRGSVDGSKEADAAFGDGFPPFPAKGTNAPRPQIHVWLRFAEPVVGPILLGAGRYLGYGLCKPLRESRL